MEMSVVLRQPPPPHAPPPGAAAALAALAAAAAASSWAVPAADAVFGGYPFGIPFSNCERTLGNRAFPEGFLEIFFASLQLRSSSFRSRGSHGGP